MIPIYVYLTMIVFQCLVIIYFVTQLMDCKREGEKFEKLYWRECRKNNKWEINE